jgi:FKBP-type peptidyl-prolyl cis-trans isomerase
MPAAGTGGVPAPVAREQRGQEPVVNLGPGAGNSSDSHADAYLMRSGTAAKPSPNDTRVAVDAGKGQPEQRPAASWQPPQRARAATRDFLQENAAREGVVSLPSGLQYKVLKRGDGTGRTPQLTDTVAVRYRGRLPDGREFDNSDNRGGQVSLAISELIPGWREALLKMEEGAQWELYVPPALAVPRGTLHKPGALGLQALIYDIELVAVQ